MGLIRASVITGLCYVFFFKIWSSKIIPLPEKLKQSYDKYILLVCIFVIEILF